MELGLTQTKRVPFPFPRELLNLVMEMALFISALVIEQDQGWRRTTKKQPVYFEGPLMKMNAVDNFVLNIATFQNVIGRRR